MKKVINLLFVILVTNSITVQALSSSPIIIPQARDVSLPNGFGGYNHLTGSGTTGGSVAQADMIFLVHNKKELLTAINRNKGLARIIQVSGIIDMSENHQYKNFSDQKSRSLIKIPSNTTLIGIDNNSGFIHGSISLKNVTNVIIRNLHIQSPIDVEPKFEEGDGWNAEWDGINIITSNYVWIDHVKFTDGSFTDDMYQQKDGWKYVQHDGLLDIKKGSDLITVSYCIFENHDKAILIGHSDNNINQDKDKLRITFHHNLFMNVRQRTPRVRFGKIHMYNNVFIGTTSKSQTAYPYQYSMGIGLKGSLFSENNFFLIKGLKESCRIVKEFGNNNVRDMNSTLNHSPLNWSTCHFNQKIDWSIPYQYVLDDSERFITNYGQFVGNGNL